MAFQHPSSFRTLVSAAIMVALAAGAGCSDDSPAATAPTPINVALSETIVTLVRGQNETAQVNATVEGTSNAGVTWTSGNSAIATVSPTGVITAVSDGETFVTARSDADPSVNRSVVVRVVSTIVTVAPAATFSWVGGPARQFSSTVENNPNTNVTWSSTNALVATVSATGSASPVAPGSANIVATSVADGTKQASGVLTVDPAPVGTQIQSGVANTNLAAATGATNVYWIAVPPGATQLRITTTGGTGDGDIYIRVATTAAANQVCSSFNDGNVEECTIANPQPRAYHILHNAWEAFTGITLTATVTMP